MSGSGAPVDAGHTWLEHLRTGGTVPWREWRATHRGVGTASARDLPGAQQLELLRRLNLKGPPTATLAERVLAASAPGRGRPDLGLVGVLEESRFGPPPVDPADLPADELVRVATSLLAEDVVAAGDPPAPRSASLLRRRRRYRLLGDPELSRPVREALIADGRPPGGAGATVVVLGTALDTMLTHLWTARAFGAGVRPWRHWLASEAGRGTQPPRVDLAALAESWSSRVGAGRVHVVIDDAALAARLVGHSCPVPGPAPLSADAVELARRTAPVVGSLVSPERRSLLMWHRFRPVLAAYAGPPLRVPRGHHAWLAEQTEDLRRRLSRGGYAVHGDLPEPSERPGVTAPDEERVLALAMLVLLAPPVGDPVATDAAGRTWEPDMRGRDT